MNQKRISSKSSLRSSSSGKVAQNIDEVSRLQAEVDSLKQTVELLKVSIESRDAAIENLAKEKEKLYVELKSAQRTNRNLHQQLEDERGINSKQADFLNQEIMRLSQKDREYQNTHNENSNEFIESLKAEIKAKDKVIYNMGAKYLKIKSRKHNLKKSLQKLQLQNQKTCENIIMLLEENRKNLDNLLNNLIKYTKITPNSRKYLELLQVNAGLHFENTQMKVCLSDEFLLQELFNDQQQSDDKSEESYEEAPIISGAEPPRKQKNCESKQKHRIVPKYFKTARCNADLSDTWKRSRKTKLVNHVSCRHFKSLHEKMSPYFPRKIRCTKSDSYLIRS